MRISVNFAFSSFASRRTKLKTNYSLNFFLISFFTFSFRMIMNQSLMSEKDFRDPKKIGELWKFSHNESLKSNSNSRVASEVDFVSTASSKFQQQKKQDEISIKPSATLSLTSDDNSIGSCHDINNNLLISCKSSSSQLLEKVKLFFFFFASFYFLLIFLFSFHSDIAVNIQSTMIFAFLIFPQLSTVSFQNQRYRKQHRAPNIKMNITLLEI